MKYVIFDTEKAKQILDASTEFYLDDVSEQISNIFGFDRVEVNSGKRLTQYDLKIRGNGIFSAGFILKLFGSSLIVERKLRFLRGLFVTAWVLLFLYTAICGYMMTDLYQDYTIEPGDIPILTGLIVLLAGTMIYFCVKTSVTKKIITSVVEEKIVRPANQESIDLEREAERLGDIMFYDEKLPDISEMTDEEVEKYLDSVNPYDYLKQDNYAFTCDKNGIILDDSVKSRILFVNSSGSIRGSDPIPINKRLELIRWAQERDAVIIEDDFNGELRCTSKPVPALQSMSPSHVVYIGSFSKLLLPSVRISYMVLPPSLAEKYAQRMSNYNQTSSKTEQLALAHYISSGRLDRQLRRLRKLYSEKSQKMYDNVKATFPDDTTVEIIETALCVRIKLHTEKTMDEIVSCASSNGIRLGKCREKNGLKYFYLSFAGICSESIPEAVRSFYEVICI